jgi:hypothetical protein
MRYFNPGDVNGLIHFGGARPAMTFGRRHIHRTLFFCVATGSLLVSPVGSHADCEQQLQRLSTDLRGIALTETQKQTIGGMVDDARRYCWVHQEAPAMEIITRARRVARLKPAGEEFDWETVPLESLERR